MAEPRIPGYSTAYKLSQQLAKAEARLFDKLQSLEVQVRELTDRIEWLKGAAIDQLPIAGGDPLIEMAAPDLLRLPEVEKLTRMKKSTIYAQMRLGTFPKPVAISSRGVAWRVEELKEWIKSAQPKV